MKKRKPRFIGGRLDGLNAMKPFANQVGVIEPGYTKSHGEGPPYQLYLWDVQTNAWHFERWLGDHEDPMALCYEGERTR